MTVKPSWRFDQSKYDRYGEQFNPVERMKILGVLIPDTRLQTIADAWDEGIIEPMSDGIRVAHKSVQDWWPVLAALLEALAKEERGWI